MKSRRVVTANACLAIAGLLLAGSAWSQHRQVPVYQALTSLETQPLRSDRPSALPARLSFIAFGRQFTLALSGNGRLKSGLPAAQQQATAAVQLYRGTLEGMPDSWVRLSRVDGELTGVIWDGYDYYGIAPVRRVDPRFRTTSTLGPQEPVIFRLQDRATLPLPTTDLVVKPPATGSDTASTSTAEPSTAALQLPVTPARRLNVGFVADSAFAANADVDAQSDLLAIANIVDGIYLLQLGVQINVTDLEVLAGDGDPFDNYEPDALLDAFASYKTASPTLSGLGLAHLFTGHDLVEVPATEDQTVGIAYLGAVCNPFYGVGVTQGTIDIPTSALIAAHEIGHNFGAPHDNEDGSACADTPGGYLMDPYLNGNKEFSQCSIEQMVLELASVDCLEPLPPGDVSVRETGASGPLAYGDGGFLHFAVDSSGSEDALAVAVEFATSGSITLNRFTGPQDQDWPCKILADAWRCTTAQLPAGETGEFALDFSATQPGDGQVTVTVDAANDTDGSNNTLVHAVSVGPAVDLVTNITTDGSLYQFPGISDSYAMAPGQQAQFQVTVRNTLVSAANGVQVVLRFGFLDERIEAVLPDQGSCAPGLAALNKWTCELGDLPPGGERMLTATVRARPSFTEGRHHEEVELSAAASADQADFDEQTNYSQLAIHITDALVNLTLSKNVADEYESGSTGEYRLAVGNDGPDDAVDVMLTLDNRQGGLGFEQPTVTANMGECALGQRQGLAECRVDRLPAGATMVVAVTGKAGSAGETRVEAYAESASLDVALSPDRWTNFLVTVAEAPPPSTGTPPATAPAPPAGGGGGGGGFDWLSLLLLMLVGAYPRRYCVETSDPAHDACCGLSGKRARP